MQGSVTITFGGGWQDGAVTGGDWHTRRPVDLTQPTTIGRSHRCDLVIPDPDDRVSGVAAVLVASGTDVKLHVWNRAGAVVLPAMGIPQTFPWEEDRSRARARRAVLVFDGDVLWLPPEPLGPARSTPHQGGFWLRLDLPSLPTGDSEVTGADADRPSVGTDLEPRDGSRKWSDVRLNADQRSILTAVYAEAVAPIADQPYQRASTTTEVAAMVWPVGAGRPSKEAVEQRIRTLVQTLERQTGTVLPHAPGQSINQRLFYWCKVHVPLSWFDHEQAERMLAERPAELD